MNDDDVRHVLSAYAATAPDLDPKAGLGERIARRDRVRRATVAGVACLAALVAGSGVAVLTSGGDRGTAGIVAADDPTPTESPAPEPTIPPSEEPEPTASPTPARPAHAPATPEASDPPAESPSPAPPADPIVRTARGKHGLSVRMTITPGSVATATSATVRVEAHDDDGDPQVVGLRWGDGSHVPIVMAYVSCRASQDPVVTPSPPREPKPATSVDTYRHAWRHAGDYVLKLTVQSYLPCDQESEYAEEVEIEVPFTATAGRVTSNGPERPTATFDEYGPAESETERHMRVNATFHDPDGHLADILIDWGDGSTPKTTYRESACDDGDGRHYPMVWGPTSFEDTHVYREPGTYTVTFTVMTTGCDGLNGQRVTTSGTVVVE